ncbi:hypothetical protein FWK35_00015489 [Aphis craccivora]|uniref:Uncharacterized protein n=1 Tax=Aphis craccivora TaxID=307492 RepID=A0A6G0YZQ9_APHCR|nr:hypothetical protein FWK35_00015489 [Aphis craccivora]
MLQLVFRERLHTVRCRNNKIAKINRWIIFPLLWKMVTPLCVQLKCSSSTVASLIRDLVGMMLIFHIINYGKAIYLI